jgi:hypothetical protein
LLIKCLNEGIEAMSEYRLDIRGSIDLSDYSNISDYIELVDNDDRFTITLEAIDSQNFDLICSMLTDKKFIIATKGECSDGKMYISAVRKKQNQHSI